MSLACVVETIKRKTTETDISVSLKLDGTGKYKVQTGIGFFDHMLEQLARHSLIDLEVKANGDTHIDDHHTVEDTGIALGQALTEAIGNKEGINRYGWCLLPMDDTLSEPHWIYLPVPFYILMLICQPIR